MNCTPVRFITPKYRKTPNKDANGSRRYEPPKANNPISNDTPIVVTRCSRT